MVGNRHYQTQAGGASAAGKRRQIQACIRSGERGEIDHSANGRDECQPGILRHAGLRPGATATENLAELTPLDEIEAIQQILEPLLKGQKDAARFSKRYIHKNGSHVWGDVSTVMRRDPAGKPLHFITTIVDITERKRAEIDLQILSSRNQAMLEAIPDIIMEVDTNKVYTWANRAGIEFFGADVIGKAA